MVFIVCVLGSHFCNSCGDTLYVTNGFGMAQMSGTQFLKEDGSLMFAPVMHLYYQDRLYDSMNGDVS